MAAPAQAIEGRCHCGGIQVTLESSRPPAEIEARACQCGFCTRHGAMTVSDPAGRAVFDIAPDALAAYQFATRGGEVLLCRVCGTYAGVVVREGEQLWSVVNVRGMGMAEFAGRSPVPVVYDGETRDARITRRKRNWTPSELRVRVAGRK